MQTTDCQTRLESLSEALTPETTKKPCALTGSTQGQGTMKDHYCYLSRSAWNLM